MPLRHALIIKGKYPLDKEYMKGAFDGLVGQIVFGPNQEERSRFYKIRFKKWVVDKVTNESTNDWFFLASDVKLV